MEAMVQEIQRLKHILIDVLGKEFKDDFDEFSLILNEIDKTQGCYTIQ